MRRALPLRHIVATVATVALTAVAGASAQPDAKPSLRVRTVGEGTVNSRDGRIDCGLRCSARYRRGAVVSLSATPERFFAFDHWTGGCVGTAPRCFVVLNRAQVVSAAFSRKTARVTMSVSGPGTVRSAPEGIVCGREDDACSADLPVGTEITLTPSADVGGVFGVWNEPCRSAGREPCTLVLDGDVEILAAFGHTDPDPDQPQLTVNPEGAHVTSVPPGIDCPPTCQAEFPSGTYVTLRGNISKWSGLCVGVRPLLRDRPRQLRRRRDGRPTAAAATEAVWRQHPRVRPRPRGIQRHSLRSHDSVRLRGLLLRGSDLDAPSDSRPGQPVRLLERLLHRQAANLHVARDRSEVCPGPVPTLT